MTSGRLDLAQGDDRVGRRGHAQISLPFEQFPQHLTHDRRVVDNQNVNELRRRHVGGG
jgi:hypothetical protein